jgi:hypothetical protein
MAVLVRVKVFVQHFGCRAVLPLSSMRESGEGFREVPN